MLVQIILGSHKQLEPLLVFSYITAAVASRGRGPRVRLQVQITVVAAGFSLVEP